MRKIVEVDDFGLLRRFVEADSQHAFSQLVSRHINLVYSVCLRETGDATLAQDVTQAVFLILFRKARSIRRGTVLAGWLFNTARFAAKNARRGEMRRRAMEQVLADDMAHSDNSGEHWNAIEPLLHEALASLGAKDRDAILLRYFEDKSLREVANALGTTEKTAQMRVARALEKLRKYLHKHGVAAPLTILGAALLENAVRAAPASCAQASITAIFSSSTTAKSHLISQEVLKSMFVSKLKSASLVAALSVTGIVGTMYFSGAVASRDAGAARTIPTQNPALPSGAAILRKSKAAYAALSTYEGKTTSHTESLSKTGYLYKRDSTSNVEFQRPNVLRVYGLDTDGEPYTLTYDGRAQKPADFLSDIISESLASTTIPAILLGIDSPNRFAAADAAKLEGKENIDGATCHRVSLVRRDEKYTLASRYVFWVDAETFLLRRYQQESQYPSNIPLTFIAYTENFTIESAS